MTLKRAANHVYASRVTWVIAAFKIEKEIDPPFMIDINTHGLHEGERENKGYEA